MAKNKEMIEKAKQDARYLNTGINYDFSGKDYMMKSNEEQVNEKDLYNFNGYTGTIAGMLEI